MTKKCEKGEMCAYAQEGHATPREAAPRDDVCAGLYGRKAGGSGLRRRDIVVGLSRKLRNMVAFVPEPHV